MADTLIDRLTSAEDAQQALAILYEWASANMLTTPMAVQLGVIAAALLFARMIATPVHNGIERLGDHRLFAGKTSVVLDVIADQATALVVLILTFIGYEAARRAGWPAIALDIASSLLAAWVMIRVSTKLLANRAMARTVAVVAWSIAALDILNLLEPTMAALDGIGLTLGVTRLTALAIIKGVILIFVLVWLALMLSNMIEHRIEASDDLTPSVKVLLGKLVHFVMVVVAVLAGVSGVGIDLTALTVFTGALGFGIGFGMQKVVSNLMSGVILLVDKSVKPGDVIAIGDTYGWVNSMSARHVSLVTRDGIEYLIPN
jgi:small-conductance mechanosensitive channel